MFIPDLGSDFFHPESRTQGQKMFQSSQKIWDGMFIPDPDFFSIPDPGVKNNPDPGSGSATLDLWMIV
jgi:hypothetical protein